MNIWNPLATSGINLATVIENQPVDITFPTIGFPDGVTFNIISGQLPPGLTILGNKIIGTPNEVSKITPFKFVVRATNLTGQISDRTFIITVEGNNIPQWVTPAGKLPINPNGLTFVLDNTLIDFQLSAIDSDIVAGGSLEFFIEEGNGELPPGLSLSRDGRISGYVKALPALDITQTNGAYDTTFYDSFFYDFREKDKTTPKKLNRNYQFIVSVSDGTSIIKREFLIYVVGDNFVRADNSILNVSTGVFTADSTYVRKVYWNTPSDLGIKRANNYVTIFLDTIDPNPQVGPVIYRVEPNNPDTTDSQLPLGLFIDETNGELFGYVPYQPAVTKEYKFTVSASKYDRNAINVLEIEIQVLVFAPYGQNYLEISKLSDTNKNLLLNETIKIGNYYYTIADYQEISNARAHLILTRNLFMDVPVNTVITKTIIESAVENTATKSLQTFTIKILGEVESAIVWETNTNLGEMRANIPSMISVSAKSLVAPTSIIKYKITDGQLPPGLSLLVDGNLIGIVDQSQLPNNLKEHLFKFKIKASELYGFSELEDEFTLKVLAVDSVSYSNVYVKPYQKLNKRTEFFDFINDYTVFVPEKIYRLNDENFGIQSDLKMLIFPGIETVSATEYISAMAKNTKRKRFRLGNPKLAVAKKYGSNLIEYEVIYLEVFDDYEIGNISATSKIQITQPINSAVSVNQSRRNRITMQNTPITVDSTAVKISGNDLEFAYPSSVSNMRKNLSSIKTEDNRQILFENEFLPLWMLTPQDNKTAATGFIKAVPLCYCKPGEGNYILLNIEKRNFDFTSIDYEIDRFIIDSTTENDNNQYLKFRNYKFNI